MQKCNVACERAMFLTDVLYHHYITCTTTNNSNPPADDFTTPYSKHANCCKNKWRTAGVKHNIFLPTILCIHLVSKISPCVLQLHWKQEGTNKFWTMERRLCRHKWTKVKREGSRCGLLNYQMAPTREKKKNRILQQNQPPNRADLFCLHSYVLHIQFVPITIFPTTLMSQ